jgi:site-specific recombinase XerD
LCSIPGQGSQNATLQQRITAVRLFYDYLMEEGHRPTNPVGRGRYTPGKGFAGARDRGLIPRFTKLPWIPDDQQWEAVLETARKESFRNRVMLALSYDSGLRREELCGLETSDIDPAHRMITIRAEITKTRRARIVPYSPATGELLAVYLRRRRELSRERGRLFLSESRRNTGRPVSKWTWSKVVEGDRGSLRRPRVHDTQCAAPLSDGPGTSELGRSRDRHSPATVVSRRPSSTFI